MSRIIVLRKSFHRCLCWSTNVSMSNMHIMSLLHRPKSLLAE